MNISKYYDKFWSNDRNREGFREYERNLVLEKCFNKYDKVLDLGCGDGTVGYYLKKIKKCDVTGYDISSAAVKKARNKGLRVFWGSIEEKLPFKNNEFDKVFWGDNIEHLFNPESALIEIKRILKPGGKLILSCPNMAYWRYRVYYLLEGNLADTEWSGNPPWKWGHIRFFNTLLVKQLLNKNSLSVEKVYGVNKRRIDGIIAKLIPSLFANILVVVAKKYEK